MRPPHRLLPFGAATGVSCLAPPRFGQCDAGCTVLVVVHGAVHTAFLQHALQLGPEQAHATFRIDR